jgi:hypothetical protein
MTFYVNSSGTQRKVKDVWVNNGGTWTRVKVLRVNRNGTWSKVFAPEVRLDYLVVGGGGSGGGGRPDPSGGGGGGGGGGGVLTSFVTADPVNFSTSVTIGSGGLTPGYSNQGNDGTATVLAGTISALAGGGFGGGAGNVGTPPIEQGGGGGLPNGAPYQPSSNGTYNGIGAGSGGRGRDDTGGRLGGAGFIWPINKVTYSGGGGGGGEGGSPPTSYSGGAGGGGQGGNFNETGYPATFYGGGGGGGGGNNGGSNSGGVGYAGTAVFSYVWPVQLFNGGTVTSQTTNGVTRWFHTFFNNGTLTGV